jgi:hypothetical protein
LTEISIDDNGQETTEIRAEFEWGQETIETIRNINTKMFDSLEPAEQEMFLVSIERPNSIPLLLFVVCDYAVNNKLLLITILNINSIFSIK